MPGIDLHRLGEERSIAMHRAIARRLPSEPALLEAARRRVEQWLATGAVHPDYARAWHAILNQPLERIALALVEESEDARALRQTSPFAGALEPRERWRIHRQVAEQSR
jgi:hypothetical protein